MADELRSTSIRVTNVPMNTQPKKHPKTDYRLLYRLLDEEREALAREMSQLAFDLRHLATLLRQDIVKKARRKHLIEFPSTRPRHHRSLN